MTRRIVAYVLSITAVAVGSVLLLYSFSAVLDTELVVAAASFVLVGFVCHAFSYRLNTSAAASISFIPFLTAVAISPHWSTPLLIAAAVAVVELMRRAQLIKAVFNVSQQCLSAASAASALLALGGVSLHKDERFLPVSYGAMVAAFFVVNTFAVSGAIAMSSGRSWLEVWRRQTVGTLKYDILAFPTAYLFALVYNRFAFAGIVFLTLLLVGVRQLYRINRQLETTNQELLQVMVAAIEMRDPYTSGHSQRVSEYSTLIARAIGLSAKRVERITIAALLHDVGKIDQRFAAILQKPGRLTEEERAVIEEHPIKSAELVAMVSGLSDLVGPVRHHHERWDGGGYPDKLAGDNIPLASRIIAFADTIDAMTSDRPYRPALGPNEVKAELLKHRGKQFDPEICDKLLASPLFLGLFGKFPQPTSSKTSVSPDRAA